MRLFILFNIFFVGLLNITFAQSKKELQKEIDSLNLVLSDLSKKRTNLEASIIDLKEELRLKREELYLRLTANNKLQLKINEKLEEKKDIENKIKIVHEEVLSVVRTEPQLPQIYESIKKCLDIKEVSSSRIDFSKNKDIEKKISLSLTDVSPCFPPSKEQIENTLIIDFEKINFYPGQILEFEGYKNNKYIKSSSKGFGFYFIDEKRHIYSLSIDSGSYPILFINTKDNYQIMSCLCNSWSKAYIPRYYIIK